MGGGKGKQQDGTTPWPQQQASPWGPGTSGRPCWAHMAMIHNQTAPCTRGANCWHMHSPVISKADFAALPIPKAFQGLSAPPPKATAPDPLANAAGADASGAKGGKKGKGKGKGEGKKGQKGKSKSRDGSKSPPPGGKGKGKRKPLVLHCFEFVDTGKCSKGGYKSERNPNGTC